MMLQMPVGGQQLLPLAFLYLSAFAMLGWVYFKERAERRRSRSKN